MSTYIFGDIQGCYSEFQSLLEIINFNPETDQLGFVGDLVNRGPQSLETLRFIKNLKEPIVVLGNHDLFLLALGYAHIKEPNSLLEIVLNAPDKIELLDWLRQQPLMHIDQDLNYTLVHAGIPPQWSIAQAYNYSNEVCDFLRGDNYNDFLANMEGMQPNNWNNDLQGWDKLRYIVNALTRIRFCSKQGQLDLTNKTTQTTTENLQAWYEWRNDDMDIVFGHWASLQGQCKKSRFFALDTGCVWGGKLTALRVDDRQLFQLSCE